MQSSRTLKILSILLGLTLTLVSAGCPKKKAKTPKAKTPKAKTPKAKTPPHTPPTATPGKPPAKPAGADEASKDLEQVKRARAALMPLKKKLMGELKVAMKAGGFEKAIEACKIKAPAITKALNAKGIRVGRASHRARNADNAPKAEWLKRAIETYAKTSVAELEAKKVKPYLLTKIGDRFGYAEPIYVKPLCLSCHGDKKTIPPKIAKLIEKAYPQDRARGFHDGDFRGLFWVELPRQDPK